MRRRSFLRAGARWLAAPAALQAMDRPMARADGRYPGVSPEDRIVFPRDFGAHPDFRSEWWYITGWLRAAGPGQADPAANGEFGFQITFFRARTTHDDRNPSRFAPRQLILAHAVLALPARQRLMFEEKAARTGFDYAGADQRDTAVSVGRWSLNRTHDDRYVARIVAREFDLDLELSTDRPPALQGVAGYSRKGPRPEQASHYYSRPQLRVTGSVKSNTTGQRPVQGIAWLDHEWSSEILDERAAGWDWIGLNLDDGTSLMAFRIRGRDQSIVWSHARFVGQPESAAPQPVFEPLRLWRSARTGVRYPVAMRVTVGARVFELQPLFDDQELDARASTGTIYWEGAVRVLESGRPVGRGYLELTGYAAPVKI